VGPTVTNIIIPLFGVMALGSLFGFFRILEREGSAFLSRFVFVVALPALIFVKLQDVPLEEFFDWPFLGALGGGMIVTLGIGLAVARFVYSHGITSQGLHALTGMYSSTGYIGLPLILVAFGDRGLVPGIIGVVVTAAVFLPVVIILAEFDRTRQTGKFSFRPLLRVFRNPVLIATAAGLLASAFHVNVPPPVISLGEVLGAAFVPCSLFAAGLFISGGIGRTSTGEIGWLVFAKLALHPLITWWLAYHVFMLDSTLAAIVVIQAALPTGVPVFVLAQEYRQFERRSNAVIVISTGISVFTLSALLVFLAP